MPAQVETHRPQVGVDAVVEGVAPAGVAVEGVLHHRTDLVGGGEDVPALVEQLDAVEGAVEVAGTAVVDRAVEVVHRAGVRDGDVVVGVAPAGAVEVQCGEVEVDPRQEIAGLVAEVARLHVAQDVGLVRLDAAGGGDGPGGGEGEDEHHDEQGDLPAAVIQVSTVHREQAPFPLL